MFSALGNILVNKPRQAETTDTRQGIRRHDPEHERKKNKKRDSDGPVGFDEDDSAIVSVAALRVFLENFLKSTENAAPAESKKEENSSETIPYAQDAAAEPARPSGQAAHAAHAYQHSARTGENTYSAADGQASETVAQSLGLSSAEVRTIHTLLEDLKNISDRKIEYLHIERSESFLQSLVEAVKKINA
jgi:hypothetical protein